MLYNRSVSKKNDVTKMANAIGIFDSGLGGLTVVKQIISILPHENIIYLGDTARVPYGPRSPEIIKRFSEENTKFLIGKNVKCIIIACNTSSAVAAGHLKRKFHNIPIFEVIKPAITEAKKSVGSKIGVIGTRATIASGAYKVNFSVACPLLVPFIEEGDVKGKALQIILKDYLKPLKGKIDTLILGCTHYPIIEHLIQKEIGKKVKLINPEKMVAFEVQGFLQKNNILNSQKEKGKIQFFVTDLTERVSKVAEMFLGQKISGVIQKVNL